MAAPTDYTSLSVEERSHMIEAIWDSIAESPERLPDPPEVVRELRERKARYLANPSAGVTWDEFQRDIESGRG